MNPKFTKEGLLILLTIVQRDHEALAAQLRGLVEAEQHVHADLRVLAETLRQWEAMR